MLHLFENNFGKIACLKDDPIIFTDTCINSLEIIYYKYEIIKKIYGEKIWNEFCT